MHKDNRVALGLLDASRRSSTATQLLKFIELNYANEHANYMQIRCEIIPYKFHRFAFRVTRNSTRNSNSTRFGTPVSASISGPVLSASYFVRDSEQITASEALLILQEGPIEGL